MFFFLLSFRETVNDLRLNLCFYISFYLLLLKKMYFMSKFTFKNYRLLLRKQYLNKKIERILILIYCMKMDVPEAGWNFICNQLIEGALWVCVWVVLFVVSVVFVLISKKNSLLLFVSEPVIIYLSKTVHFRLLYYRFVEQKKIFWFFFVKITCKCLHYYCS